MIDNIDTHERRPEADYFFPIIPKDTKREPFHFVDWNGFAVSPEEFQSIQDFLNDEEARKTFAVKYQKGKMIRSVDGTAQPDEIGPDIAAIRSDGVSFFLSAVRAKALQTSDDPKIQTREKGTGRGTFMTRLVDFDIDRRGNPTHLSRLPQEDREKTISNSTGIYSLSSAMEVVSRTLLPQARNEHWHTSLSLRLSKKGSYEPNGNLFAYEGKEFEEYMRRAAQERSSVVWGINLDSIQSGRYQLGYGDFGKHSIQKEIDVKGLGGILMSDIAFIATRPGSLEDQIGIACLDRMEGPKTLSYTPLS